MYWSMPLSDHLKIKHSNITVTNHLVKDEELLLLVWKGPYHHLTIRSRDIMKNPFVLYKYLFSNILAQMFSPRIDFS